jgi:PqqD family protein of HPr-rel-A system
LVAPDAYAVFPLDDDIVLYDRRSGQTHLLSGMAASVIEALLQGSLTRQSLEFELKSAVEAEDDAAFADALAESLTQLLSLDLIEAIDA